MKRRIRRRVRRDQVAGLEPIGDAARKALETLESRRMLAVSMGSDGFTVVTPSSDTRNVYVSSSSGNDANDGSSPSEAVKTVTRGVQLVRSGMPDHLLLKKGDTFTSGFARWNKSGRNAQEPLLISSYGSGERPYLKTGTGAGFQSDAAFHDVAIIGLRFEANTRNPNSPDFQGSAGAYGLHTVGPINGLLVENSSFSYYVYNGSITGFTGYAKNVKIRRSAFTDSWTNNDKAVGFYSSNTEGMLLEENLFDHNGWNENSKAIGGMAHPSHDVYLWESTRDPIIKGNIFSRAGQHGLQARGGGTIENNLFLKNPIGLLVGNGSTVRAGGVVGKVSGNVFLDSRDMNGQPRGWAVEFGNIKPGGGSYFRDNIIANDAQLKYAAIVLQTDTGATNPTEGVGVNDLTIENNIIYDWYQGISIASGFDLGGSGQLALNDLVVRDNDFQKTSNSKIIYQPQGYDSSAEKWQDNRYWNATADSGWFYLGGKTTSLDAWDATVESSPTNEKVKYSDPERDIAKYSKSVGADESLGGFVSEVRDQQQGNWRGVFTAKAAIAWIRAGFGRTTNDQPDPTPDPTPTPTPTPSKPDLAPTPQPIVDNELPTVLWSKFDPASKTITMKFSEDVSRSLNTGDLRLKNLSNSSLITYANMKMSYDKQTNTAIWSINTDMAEVNWKVMLSWSEVSDADGNKLDGNGDGKPGLDHVMYIAPSEVAAINSAATGANA